MISLISSKNKIIIKILLINHCIFEKIFLFSVLDRFVSGIIGEKKFYEFTDFVNNLK